MLLLIGKKMFPEVSTVLSIKLVHFNRLCMHSGRRRQVRKISIMELNSRLMTGEAKNVVTARRSYYDWMSTSSEQNLVVGSYFCLTFMNYYESDRDLVTCIQIHQTLQQYTISYNNIDRRANFWKKKRELLFIRNLVIFIFHFELVCTTLVRNEVQLDNPPKHATFDEQIQWQI